MNNNIIEGLNKAYNEFSQNYITFCSNFAFKRQDIMNDSILVNELMMFEVSINDLVIQLQNINFKLDMIQNNLSQNNDTIPPLDINTNKLIDKTMKEMMPLFFCALMNNDKNSILNNNTFMQNVIDTMSNMTTKSNSDILQSNNTNVNANNSEHNVEDVD